MVGRKILILVKKFQMLEDFMFINGGIILVYVMDCYL